MKNVLFICVHNAARSQMAQAYLQHYGEDEFNVQSAGLKPTSINPLAIQVMQEDGIDISNNATQSILTVFGRGDLFDYVITVCEENVGECPVYPGITHRMHMPYPDPAAVEGSEEEKLAKVRAIRDDIKKGVQEFVSFVKSGGKVPLSQRWQAPPEPTMSAEEAAKSAE